MSLRDYFIAHAPPEPAWEFDVPMDCPEPCANTDNKNYWNWKNERCEKQLRMWPGVWADSMLIERERSKHQPPRDETYARAVIHNAAQGERIKSLEAENAKLSRSIDALVGENGNLRQVCRVALSRIESDAESDGLKTAEGNLLRDTLAVKEWRELRERNRP
jgi:hypothetical protein